MTTDLVARGGSPYAVAIATALTTFVVLTFCELTPKTLAKRHAVWFALLFAPAVRVIDLLLYPATVLLLKLTGGLTALFGGRRGPKGPSVTGAEIEYLIDLGSREGVLDDVKKELLSSVLEFADRLVREIMVPRTKIIGIERGASFDQAMKVIADSDHSRIPIYGGSVDNVVGVLFVKDLARDLQRGLSAATFRLEKYVKPPFFVPGLMKISRLLREFQKRKTHMAVVVDEFGGTSGLVTLEDVVEEIVGEIQDEYDVEEKTVKSLPDGRFVADGSAPLRDVEAALAVEFPEGGDYETLGGFLTAVSGRVPLSGNVVTWGGWAFTIRAADERRVSKVEISRAREGPDAAPKEGPAEAPPRPA
jgi:CBS domain containing-hemolysin-like protein